MRRLALLSFACVLALALPGHAKAAGEAVAIGQCGLPSSGLMFPSDNVRSVTSALGRRPPSWVAPSIDVFGK